MRFLLLLLILALLLVAACGGDDDDATSTATRAVSASPSASAVVTPTGQPTDVVTPSPTSTAQASLEPSPSPTRRPGVAADHYGVNTSDVLGVLAGVIPDAVPCPYDATEVVIDCSAQGYGRIALDLVPRGEISECRALTRPEDGVMIAASCTTTEPAGWFYKIVE